MLRGAERDGYVQDRRSPFVMLRGAKRSRSTQAQRFCEDPEPGSRDYARDDELGTRGMTSYLTAPGPRCVWAREVKCSQVFVGLDGNEAVPLCEYQRARWRR